MTLRQVSTLALVALALGGCRKKEPPVTVAPAAESTTDTDALAQARADSIAAAERARREAEERARAAAVARAREALSEVIYFEYDSQTLTPESEAKLRTKAAILRANPSVSVRVEGHADERGSTEYNLALGQRRAETIRDFLAGYGIAGNRVATISYGEERPAVEGSTEAAWAQNRRGEFAMTGGEIASVPPEVGG